MFRFLCEILKCQYTYVHMHNNCFLLFLQLKTYLNASRGAHSASRATTANVGIVAAAAGIGCSIVANFCIIIGVSHVTGGCPAYNTIILVLVLIAFHLVELAFNLCTSIPKNQTKLFVVDLWPAAIRARLLV